MRQPDYQRGDVTLYLGDCLEILPELEAGSVDAVVTDPPYGVGFDSELWDKIADYSMACENWFRAWQATGARAIAITPGLVNVHIWCGIEPPKWILCWHKPAAMKRSPFGFCNWDAVLFYGKPAKRHGYTDVIRAPIVVEDIDHPCPKPVVLMEGLVERCSVLANTILDPFMGSGTTGVACIRTGRRFIGVELESKYFDIACKRIDAELDRTALIEPAEPAKRKKQPGLQAAGQVGEGCP